MHGVGDRHPISGEPPRSPGGLSQMVNNSAFERKSNSHENPLAGFSVDFVCL